MNPLLKKEIRLLSPAWGLAILLAVVPAGLFSSGSLGWTEFDHFTPILPGILILCASSFGREFSLGTFPTLLAQPFSRKQFWFHKVGVLLAAVISVLGVFVFSACAFRVVSVGGDNPSLVTVAGLLLATIAGGLWLALWIRQMMAVIWLIVLVPLLLCLPCLLILSHFGAADKTVEITLDVVLLGYAAAGIAGSWLIFRRAQDAPWSGGTINLPEWMTAAVMPRAGTNERRSMPWRALIRKELHFNQVLLLGMAALFLLDLGEVGVRFARRDAAGDFNQVFQILGIVIWVLVPLVIGCTSIAEERKLGTLEGQLCQPVSARRQYIVKLGFILIFGGVLSSLCPVIAETLARSAGLQADEPPAPVVGIMTAGMCAVALVSFFASSLARNVLQALPLAAGLAVGISAAGICLADMGGANGSLNADFILWSPLLPNTILAVLLPVTVIWLAWRNFRRLHEAARIWWRNGLGILSALALTMAASVLIYHRVWEKLTPFEPAHGPARWSMSQPPVTARTEMGNSVLITLPDGRSWLGCMIENFSGLNRSQVVRELWPRLVSPRMQGQFIAGSNWVSLAPVFLDFWIDQRTNLDAEPKMVHIVNSRETVGVKADGTLWVSEKPSGPHWNTNMLVQFGTETDWQQVLGTHSLTSVLLLKKDGTLWRWGIPSSTDTVPPNWDDLRSQIPRQIGTNSDWQKLIQMGWPLAQKKDGTLWSIGFQPKEQKNDLVLYTNIDQGALAGPDWDGQKIASGYGPVNANIRPDGTLWIWGDTLYWYWSGHQKYSVLRSSAETNWVGVAVGASTLVALKSDGTLWRWGGETRPREYAEDFTGPPKRLGIHSDWVALTRTWWGVTSLAADGSLWLWPDDSDYSDRKSMLMQPARKPIPLGNIFAEK